MLAIYIVPRKSDLLYCEIRQAEAHDLVDLQVRLSSWVLGGHGWTLSGDESGKWSCKLLNKLLTSVWCYCALIKCWH
jgi:hypothetical protein